jgi:hypothetical protein
LLSKFGFKLYAEKITCVRNQCYNCKFNLEIQPPILTEFSSNNNLIRYEIAFIKELDKYQTKFMTSISMSKRITIVLDDDLAKKLRIIQSKKVSRSTKHVSFSQIINEELRKALR